MDNTMDDAMSDALENTVDDTTSEANGTAACVRAGGGGGAGLGQRGLAAAAGAPAAAAPGQALGQRQGQGEEALGERKDWQGLRTDFEIMACICHVLLEASPQTRINDTWEMLIWVAGLSLERWDSACE